MASSTLPWERLWQTMWGMIVNPSTDGRVIVALDDTINPKTGRRSLLVLIFTIMQLILERVYIHGHNV